MDESSRVSRRGASPVAGRQHVRARVRRAVPMSAGPVGGSRGPAVTCTRLPWTRRATPGAAHPFPVRATAGGRPGRLVGTVRPALMTDPRPAALRVQGPRAAGASSRRPHGPLGLSPVGVRAGREPHRGLVCSAGVHLASRCRRGPVVHPGGRVRRGPAHDAGCGRGGRSQARPSPAKAGAADSRAGGERRQGPGFRVGGTPLPAVPDPGTASAPRVRAGSRGQWHPDVPKSSTSTTGSSMPTFHGRPVRASCGFRVKDTR